MAFDPAAYPPVLPKDMASIKWANPGLMVSDFLQYVYGFAGLALLFMLILGGFDIMTSQGNPEKVKTGNSRIMNALIGFLIVFLSYAIVKIVELMLDIKIF